MLLRKCLSLYLLLAASLSGLTQKQAADTFAISQINIPIQVKLTPFYAMAERNVDTVFTSPNFPDGWVQADCATRYKYRFRRSPLRMRMNGTTLDLSFTGFYQVSGSTRLCSGGGTVLSPWTPSCTCGVEEGERRVIVGFSSTFSLQPDYLLQTKITRKEPVAQDKCEVCFWGKDVTTEVLDGLKKSLDASKKAMEDSFRVVNLKPYMQQAWNLLNDVYNIPGIGTFRLNPKSIRMQNLSASNDLLNMNIGITASPVVSFEKLASINSPVPNLVTSGTAGGFSIFLEAALQYDSLSRVVNGYMAGKRFDLSEGLFAKHIVVNNVTVAGNAEGNLLLKVDFSGSFNGTAFFAGKPVYNAGTKTLEVQDLDYDLQAKNLLLKTAKWLFNAKIESELKKASSINLETYFDTAKKSLKAYLNQEWAKGIKGSGDVQDLRLVSAEALPQHLLIKTACAGNLSILVSEIDLDFKR